MEEQVSILPGLTETQGKEARTMRICGSRNIVVVALVWGLLVAPPAPITGQMASYLDYDGFTGELRSVVNGSDLATMESLLGDADQGPITHIFCAYIESINCRKVIVN